MRKQLLQFAIALTFATSSPAATLSPAHFAGAFAHPRPPQAGTPASTVQPAPQLTPFDLTPIAAAIANSTNLTAWAVNSIVTLGQNQAADEAKQTTDETTIAALQSQLAALNAKVSALGLPANDVLLVVPYNLPVGWSGMTSTLTEFQNGGSIQRTRRQIDFTNVHQVRLCQFLSTPLAGATIELDASTDGGATWPALIPGISLATKGQTCTAWQAYSGPAGDAIVRIAGSNSGAAGTPGWWYISLQMR